MRFSLIVCTLGRYSQLIDLFHSLMRQNRTDFETIVVDQNADDRLVDPVSQFAERLNIRHLRMSGTGSSRARNLGLNVAIGELIAFPDDDCQYVDGYLEAVDQIFRKDPSIGCICGHPTSEDSGQLSISWHANPFELDNVTVLDRCQEFTIVLRKDRLGALRYNVMLGVGAQTPWGAEEGPDLLIRMIRTGCKLVYFPHLLVYHPDKVLNITRETLQRAESYARGRGCLFRLHRFPKTIILRSVFRPAVACGFYLLVAEPKRSRYYFNTVRGTMRGLLMSATDLATVLGASQNSQTPVQPATLRTLSTSPVISVLIANYNYARFLPAALDSLLCQTYTNWHAIICDDGSTDGSAEIIKRYEDRDPRIRLIQQPNRGQTAAYNTCYRQVRGEIVCLLDADDSFKPRKLEKVISAFRTNPDAGLCQHFSRSSIRRVKRSR